MSKQLTLTLITAVFAVSGCTADIANPGRVVSLSDVAPEDCDDIREVCVLTDPVQCFSYCNDAPPECEPVACPAIYPAPDSCENTCDDVLPPIDCTTAVEFEGADGDVLVGCVTPGGPDESECDYVCTASYPSTCRWICPDGGGTVGPPCAVVRTPEGDEITDCFEPGEPDTTLPDPDCREVCTASFPSRCYSICPGDDGGGEGCAVGIDSDGVETEYCPDESGCVTTEDADGTTTELCPPGTGGGSTPPGEPDPAS